MSTAPPVPPPPAGPPPQGPPPQGPPHGPPGPHGPQGPAGGGPGGPPYLPPIQAQGPARSGNAAIWWTLGICLAVILALIAGGIVLVGFVVARASGGSSPLPGTKYGNSGDGTHLEARGGDLKIGHNRAVNACNLMSAELTAEHLGKPPANQALVSEAYAESDVAPTMLPSYGSPLSGFSTCSRTFAESGSTLGSRARLSLNAYANEETAKRAFASAGKSEERWAKRGTSSAKFTRLSDTMYATQRDSGSYQRTEIAFLSSSYAGALTVSATATHNSRPISASAQLERAKPLAEQLESRVRDPQIDSHPAAVPKLNGKAQLDACDLFTAKAYQESLLAPSTNLPTEAKVASPLVEQRDYRTAADPESPAYLEGTHTCRRAGGLRHYPWPDATQAVDKSSRWRSLPRLNATVSVGRYVSAQQAQQMVERLLTTSSGSNRRYEKVSGLGDAAVVQRSSSTSSRTAYFTVASGGYVLRFSEYRYALSRDDDQETTALPDAAYVKLIGPMLEKLS